MSNPHQVVTDLLSGAQADLLDAAASATWKAVAGSLASLAGTAVTFDEVEGRLIMPEEVSGDFADPHLVAPLSITTNRDQSATAYLVAPTSSAAAYFGSQADSPEDERQQTMIIVSTLLGQVVQAVNSAAFAGFDSGLALAMDDIVPDGMPALLAAMDEPALALTGVLKGAEEVHVTFLFPGTFLDVLAGAFQLPKAAPEQPDSLPFSLTEEELDAAELIDEMSPAEAPQPRAFAPEESALPRPLRQPTPITAAPTAHRAQFAPLPEAQPAISRHAIDLLAGLEMNVSVELGRTEMTVADVLGLGPGSVIELDRLSGEPVDILVNDRLIARGEVVVVDENFGVRVVEVLRRSVEREEAVS